jgi:thioredoxin 1
LTGSDIAPPLSSIKEITAFQKIHSVKNMTTSLVKHLHTVSEWQLARADSSATRKLCVVDFYGTWCGPCKTIAPVFDALATKYKDKASFYKVNVDEQPDLADKEFVTALPSFVFYKGQERVGQFVGASAEGLKSKLESLV